MNGENKFLVLMAFISALCIGVLGVLILYALWPQRMVVAWVLLGVACIVVVAPLTVLCLGAINEQRLRHKRYYHQDETPLTPEGVPYYPANQVSSAQPSSTYQAGYQQQQQQSTGRER